VPTPVLAFDGVIKAYGGLRPLRLRQLRVEAGEHIGLAGFDQTTAELFVNLVTGATLPDEGSVTIFGRATSAITDSTDWLATIEQFGIVSERAVLLEQISAAQNIAMSLTLDIDPMAREVRDEVESLGAAVGLEAAVLDRPIHGTSVAIRHRIRIARAIAGQPKMLLVEHPLAGVDAGDVSALGGDLARVAQSRGLAVLVLAGSVEAARPFSPRVFALNAATGDLTEAKSGLLQRLFGSGR
jgi:ABC-type transporter Mla maintaining outer membrane lipid asymmetry ATPase subunit MlaF